MARIYTTRHRGRCADPGGWAVARETAAGSPQGETPRDGANQHCRKAARRVRRVETSESNKDKEAGTRLAGQAGAAFSNPFTSELARDCENTSRSRSASGPASLPATSHLLPATAPKALALDSRPSPLDPLLATISTIHSAQKNVKCTMRGAKIFGKRGCFSLLDELE